MQISSEYASLVQWIRDNTDASDAVLHIHAGMIVLILARLVTRYPLSHPVPFIVVLVVAAANEVLNRLNFGSWRWSDTTVDFTCSVFWPAMLFVVLAMQQRVERRPALRGMSASRRR
ncbi:hypothetical protein ASE73_15910 [Sphingomonas sp. Leaf24]|uniref:hypothetical protein n=1 Tax=unclassified Sphingomonas TaxID=196159 RepID=UPI0006F30F27|nr:MULTISPECIES: hypothetical protein [unclassified Sphingomonas]KQM20920.1 hypothetical protein ASE50_15130 [Sphingomonas sp. Leaf5]KQM93321.1 hypothetical protein ASE73_15910 [Sphingomonas sp. Leaf24]